MAEIRPTTGVHLVGSVPLSSAEEVFKTACKELPGRLKSVPDGETSARDNYIVWQKDRFPEEARRKLPFADGVDLPADHPGFTADSIKPTGYDDAALASYKKFADLKTQGVIPNHVRFQVCLPHPFDSIHFFLRPEYHAGLGEIYRQRMLESVSRIISNIPADQLAIQWDMALLQPMIEYNIKGREPVVPKEFVTSSMAPLKEGYIAQLVPLIEIIPREVKVGIHLCYGDLNHRHLIEPEDTAILTDVANTTVKMVSRPLNWVHLPVPKSRDDAAYFAPLKNLNMHKDTVLYLGLVHADDAEGTKKRIATAQAAGIRDFGVATECGFGRTPVEQLDGILQISRDVSAPVVAKEEEKGAAASKESSSLQKEDKEKEKEGAQQSLRDRIARLFSSCFK